MYHTIVRWQVRRGFRDLGRGNSQTVLGMFAPQVDFFFAGDTLLSGARSSAAEVREWFVLLLRCFPGLRFEIHDVLVDGWPWDTTVATRFSVFATLADGSSYTNSGMQYVRLRWGKIVVDHVVEDTQKLAAALAVAPA